MIPTPSEAAWKPYEGMIHPKDVPVLAAAVASQAAYLVTLDQRHFMAKTMSGKVPGLVILTPGDFLRAFVHH